MINAAIIPNENETGIIYYVYFGDKSFGILGIIKKKVGMNPRIFHQGSKFGRH